MSYNTFRIVRLRNIVSWSVLQHQEHDFGYSDKYQLVPIGRLLKRNKTLVEIQDNVRYKRLSIHSKNGGIGIRDEQEGSKIGTKKQYIVKAGQFALSKIDARNGAFGVVPDCADNSIITGNFWTFDVDHDLINPFFLALISTSASFVRFAEMASNGTTNRHYLQEDKFLQQLIPLPSLDAQNAIILEYNKKMAKVNEKESNAMNTKFLINDYLKQKLGLCIISDEKKSLFKRIHFKNMTRWDFQYYKNNKQISSTYELVEIGKLMKNFMTGPNGETIRCNSYDAPKFIFTYIGMDNIEKETGVVLNYNEVTGESVKSQTIRVPMGYMIYGKLRPYLNKYWLNETDLQNIICSSEFFVFDVKENVDKKYFLLLLSDKTF